MKKLSIKKLYEANFDWSKFPTSKDPAHPMDPKQKKGPEQGFEKKKAKMTTSKDVVEALIRSMEQGVHFDQNPEWKKFYDYLYVNRYAASPDNPLELNPPTGKDWEDAISDAIASEVYDEEAGNDYGNNYGVSQEEVLDAAISDV